MRASNKRRYLTSLVLTGAGAAVLGAALLSSARGDSAAAGEPEGPVAAAGPPARAIPIPAVPATPTSEPSDDPVEVTEPEPEPEPKPRPRIDVVFALDTTGSMSHLIEGAKRKIWSLANEISSGQPRPVVRFGLVGYRDRTDAYVTKTVALTRDMDELYEHLMAFQAAGGGDTPEDVNRALSDALGKMDWGQGQNVLKLIFLVGDAPPHEDYDGPNSRELARRARNKGIIINTIRAGRAEDTRRAWQRIARIAGGEFDTIAQSGGMVAVSTPHDAELARLNRELAETGIGYGSRVARDKLERKKAARREMDSEVAASAAGYSAKGRGGLGRGDLISDVASGRISLGGLEKDALPEELQGLSRAELRALVEKKQAERKELREEILALSKKRQAWLKKRRKSGAAKDKDAFDRRVMRSVEAQAADLGVTW